MGILAASLVSRQEDKRAKISADEREKSQWKEMFEMQKTMMNMFMLKQGHAQMKPLPDFLYDGQPTPKVEKKRRRGRPKNDDDEELDEPGTSSKRLRYGGEYTIYDSSNEEKDEKDDEDEDADDIE